MHHVRRQVGEGDEHEGALRKPGMRDNEVRFRHHRRTIEEDVQVYRPGRPTCSPPPAKLVFDALKGREQIAEATIRL